MSDPKPEGKRTAQMVATLSIVAGLAVLIILAVASRRESDASSAGARNGAENPGGTVEPGGSGPGGNATSGTQEGTRDPLDGRDPMEVKRERLKEKMKQRAPENWTRWTADLERSRENRHRELDRFVKAPKETLDAIRETLRKEEAEWLKQTRAYLEPVFRGDADPKANPFTSQAYIDLVAGITQASDAHVKAMLDETQWKQYSQWRPKFNAERYARGWN
jgi:hypothetical protein